MTVNLFLQKVIRYVNIALFSASSLLTFVCVIFRYVLNDSIVWGEEIVRIMFIWMFLLGSAEAFRREKHLTLDIFLNMCTGNTKKVIKIIINVLLLYFLTVFAYLSFRNCLTNMENTTVALGISYGIVYFCFPVGSVLMIYFIACNLINLIKNKKSVGG